MDREAHGRPISRILLMAGPVPRMRAGYVDVGSSSRRSAVDHAHAVAPVRRQHPRVPRGPSTNGVHGADRHLFRLDNLPSLDCGVPRAVGVGLFLAPDVVKQIWPWSLTPLTARAIGAWLIGIGFAAFHASRENDFLRIRPLGGGYIAFAILQFVAIARYSGAVNWGSPAAWVYVAFLASVLPVGLFGWFGHRTIGTS